MDDNFNNSSMAGKVVSVLIALLFIVVLAFPIANSLGNTDNGGGSGGDSGASTDSYIGNDLKNIASHYGINGFPYNSYMQYSGDFGDLPVSQCNFEFNLQDAEELLNSMSLTENSILDRIHVRVFYMVIENYNTPVAVTYSYEDNIGKVSIQLSNTKNMTLRTNGENSGVEEFSISVVNGVGTVTWDEGYETYTGTIVVAMTFEKNNTETFVDYTLGTYDEDGSIIMAPQDPFEIYTGCALTFAVFYENDEGSDGALISNKRVEGQYDGTNYIISGTMTGEKGDYTYTVSFPCVPVESAPGVYFVSDYYDANVQLKDASGVQMDGAGINLFRVSIDTLEGGSSSGGDDSGTGSGTNIGGVASTLIKLVPILLIVSLLMVFIVPMVYKPN